MDYPKISSTLNISDSIDVERKRRNARKKWVFSIGYASMVILLSVIVLNSIYDRFISTEKIDFRYSVVRSFPHRTYSRFQGFLCKIHLPWPVNILVLGVSKKLLGIQLNEAERTRVSEYSSVNDLFTRKLHKKARTIGSGITSAADGTIVYAGRAEDSIKCPIKGVHYKVEDLLMNSNIFNKIDKNNTLQQAVIYLAPSNYHRFHSFTDFSLESIMHIPSLLLSVGKLPMKLFPGLLSKNERVIFSGTYEHGYCCLVAVGSVGVGSIHTPVVDIQTNRITGPYTMPCEVFRGKQEYSKGSELGHFSLGSTVVMIFEASPDFVWNKTEGLVNMGETLGYIKKQRV